jgi:hypothetical protein
MAMAFKSSTFNVAQGGIATGSKKTLLYRHKVEIDRVVKEAKNLAEDRRRVLEKITDPKLRASAAR